MGRIEARIDALGLILPAAPILPPGVELRFPWVRLHKDRAYISGHAALDAGGTAAPLLGKVGHDLTIAEGYQAARLTGLAILSSLKTTLGELDRIEAWLRVFGTVNAGPDFTQFPSIIDGFTDLITEIFGAEKGAHARSAVGVAGLPFNLSVEIEAEVAIKP